MQPKINLLYVITKLELGGAQTQLLSLIRGIDKTRYNLFLFTAREGLLVEDACALQGLHLHFSKHLERSVNPFKDLLALFELIQFIKLHKVDIVHTHSSKAGILGRWAAALSKIRIIIHTVHGWSFNDFQWSPIRKFYIGLERFSAKVTDALVVVSDYDRRKGLDNGIGNPAQYWLVHYGIERERFGSQDRSIRNTFKISNEETVIGTIACFKPQKAPEDFIQLASLINRVFPHVKFLMVGDGVLRRKIEKMINRLGLNSRIILTGWRKDIPLLLAAMDVFLLTSLWEGLPIAVLEAMAGGVPVVATNTGGVTDVIEDGESGFLVPCHGVSSMLKKILILLENSSLRARFRQEARLKIDDRFSTANMVCAHEKLYQSLINKQEIADAN